MKKKFALLAVILWITFTDTSSALHAETVPLFTDLFSEIVTIVETHFYNPDQITRDFPAIQAAYRKELPRISGKKEFQTLVNNMLKELNASHTYYLTPDDYEYYQLCALFSKIPEIGALFQGKEVLYPTVGIIAETIEKRVYVASVLPGSTADKAGILKGDEILSVNGAPYTPLSSLRLPPDKKATFKLRRKKKGRAITVPMTPAIMNPKKEFLDAQKKSIRVIKQNGASIGYIHIYSYAGEEYHKELHNAILWGVLKEADALIIDLRYGLGGAWPYYLNIFNRNIPALTMTNREGAETVMDSQWRKPAVYLVNAHSRSGKELLAFGAKKYHLATVIGERTPGKTLGGRLFPLSSGDTLFLAVQSCLIDGVNLEGVGVAPDIHIPFDIRYCSGQDIQIEKAIEYLARQVNKKGGDDASITVPAK